MDQAQAEAASGELPERLRPGSVELPASAVERLAELVSPQTIDRIIADAAETDTPPDGPDGVLNQVTKNVLERALGAGDG